MRKRICLSGFGTVGTMLATLLLERKKDLKEKFGLEFLITEIIGSQGSLYEAQGIDLALLLSFGKGSTALMQYAKVKKLSLQQVGKFEGDVLVECTPTNITTGEPAYGIMRMAIEKGMDIVAVSKGALITHFEQIRANCKEKKVQLFFSGATAAALPTLDIGQYSLGVSRLFAMEGILNGTTNYILTQMAEQGISFQEALQEAQEKGIAETNSTLDVQGIDSACKILLLSNALFHTNYTLEEVEIKGIEQVTIKEVQKAVEEKGVIKLIAKAWQEEGKVKLQVGPRFISKEHRLGKVEGTNKGMVFYTEDMGEIVVLGGSSSPRGAASAALKDIINIYRE